MEFPLNKELFYTLCLCLFLVNSSMFFLLAKEEKKSLARFQSKRMTYSTLLATKINWINKGKSIITLLFLLSILYFSNSYIEEVESLDKHVSLPLMIFFLPDLIWSFRFHEYFVMEEGLLSTYNGSISEWSRIESYVLSVKNEQVFFALKFKESDWFQFAERKLCKVDVDGLIELFDLHGIEKLKKKKIFKIT